VTYEAPKTRSRTDVDPLSELLRVVHLSGALFVEARLSAPWAYRSPRARLAAPLIERSADRIVILDLITAGECWLQVDGEPARHVTAGHALVYPRGDAHRMSSGPDVTSAVGARLERILARRPRRLVHGGGGAETVIVCGFLACDSRVARLLLDGLPAVLCVDLRGSRAGAWLDASVSYALEEARSPRAGGEGVLAKLAEVLFVEVLRHHMHACPSDDTRRGWLAAMRDRVVGAALTAMHRDVARDWTLEDLARASGTSRSVLAQRFQSMVGTSPIQYLTQWRMMRAADLIQTSNATLTRIAERVGYRTDTAFNRAFRREFGVPPATWRRLRRTGAGALPVPGTGARAESG
jgi:AraC-like DNA-binding protein